MTAGRIGVVIVDDSAVVRQVLSRRLAESRGIEVLGSASDPIFAMTGEGLSIFTTNVASSDRLATADRTTGTGGAATRRAGRLRRAGLLTGVVPAR